MAQKIHIIIVAAGSGSRFGATLPKQFCDLGGKPVLMRTIDACRGVLPGATVTVAISDEMLEYWQMLCETLQFDSPDTSRGGATRFESVAKALASVDPSCDIVMVHDGARPFPAKEIFDSLVSALDARGCHGAIPAVPLTDSIRRLNPDGTSEAVDRSAFRAVQTPQAFPRKVIADAYAKALKRGGEYTDDASVVESAGYSNIALVEGSPRNIKITNPGDLALALHYIDSVK